MARLPFRGFELRAADSEKRKRPVEPILGGNVKQQPGGRGNREPAARGDLGLELPGKPTGVAEKENPLPRPLPPAKVPENVP